MRKEMYEQTIYEVGDVIEITIGFNPIRFNESKQSLFRGAKRALVLSSNFRPSQGYWSYEVLLDTMKRAQIKSIETTAKTLCVGKIDISPLGIENTLELEVIENAEN